MSRKATGQNKAYQCSNSIPDHLFIDFGLGFIGKGKRIDIVILQCTLFCTMQSSLKKPDRPPLTRPIWRSATPPQEPPKFPRTHQLFRVLPALICCTSHCLGGGKIGLRGGGGSWEPPEGGGGGSGNGAPVTEPLVKYQSPRREVVRSSAGLGVVYPPFFGVIHVAYPKAWCNNL